MAGWPFHRVSKRDHTTRDAESGVGPKTEVRRKRWHVRLDLFSGLVAGIALRRKSWDRPINSRGQLLQKRFRLLQVARVEPLCEPAVNRSQQFPRLTRLALVALETRKAHSGAEFPGFGVLRAGD